MEKRLPTCRVGDITFSQQYLFSFLEYFVSTYTNLFILTASLICKNYLNQFYWL